MGKCKWNIHTMNQYCSNNQNGYKVLEIKIVEKSYQKQLWAFVKCANLDHEGYWVWWNNFVHGYYCKQCYYENYNITKWDKSKVISFYEQFGLKTININEWCDVDTPIFCEDNIGFKYHISITNLKHRNEIDTKFHTSNQYSLDNIKLFCNLYRSDYELISDKYNGIKAKYIWKYNGEFYNNKYYNREFICTADCFINGFVKHPGLTRSKLDLEIRKYLNKYNINYVTEKSFDGCVDKGKLHFDFYINYNQQEWCIEADGNQHTMVVEQWGGLKGLQDRIRKDNIKNEYCRNNNINLIRISQSKINHVEEIIIKTFINNSLDFAINTQTNIKQESMVI
jgi:hypothetical protein